LSAVTRYSLVMPAAGQGRRFGSQAPKQYASLRNRCVIEWALAPFIGDARCRAVSLALASDDARWPELRARWPAGADAPIEAAGGAERSDSVANALAALAAAGLPDDEWVLVHDAARPCVGRGDIDRLLQRVAAAAARGAAGGLLAVPLADTLKRAREGAAADDAAVEQTVPRARLWRALTPQMFRLGALRSALGAAAAAGRVPTDEAEAIEWAGGSVVLVEGAASNLKITTAADLALAAAILDAGSGS
jgi:2-C-methyl-D-erythritol 4-phosphate cytidylyltransferase